MRTDYLGLEPGPITKAVLGKGYKARMAWWEKNGRPPKCLKVHPDTIVSMREESAYQQRDNLTPFAENVRLYGVMVKASYDVPFGDVVPSDEAPE